MTIGIIMIARTNPAINGERSKIGAGTSKNGIKPKYLLSSFAFLAMTITLIPIVSIVSTVFLKGYKGIHFGMFTNDMTLASVNDPVTSGGLLHALVGTIIMVGVALIVSFPIGLLTALYLTEIRGSLARPIKFLVQAMSGVPSIVAGLFILSILVIPVTQELTGLMGSLALSILMIPMKHLRAHA